MSAIGDGFGLSARNRNRNGRQFHERQYYGSQNEVDQDGDKIGRNQPKRNGILSFSSKFYISLVLTLVIVISISQVFLFHYYFASNTNKFSSNKTQSFAFEQWHCLYPGLDDVFELAQKFGVDLVVVDPDLIGSLGIKDTNIVGHQSNQVDAISSKQTPSFSEPSKRTNQESPYKTIVHFTAINETSGGQPSLKLFYNALKNNGYIIMKYVDSSQLMQPEVYRRASHLFDDMPLDGVYEHKYSHDSNSQHNSMDYFTGNHLDPHENEVSKIYTEFITHIFILNRTQSIELRNNKQLCNNNLAARFTVIHVFVLYNYEYSPSKQWIQPGLVMDEIDKHKLLSYNVHSFDFRIPIEQYYIHQKRKVIDLTRPFNNRKSRRKRSLDRIRILKPGKGSLLVYANNSYVHCKKSQFNITGLVDNEKRLSNYLTTLDNIKPIDNREHHEFIVDQLVTALHFMDTFSKTYGNFTFWITGSSLLAYHKFCDLAIQQTYDLEAGMYVTNKLGDNMYNLEIGLYSEEMNPIMLDDLAKANNIGIVMISDWRKSSTLISFQFKECPNVIFNLYLYELRKDFHQYHYITRSSMIISHKFNKRPKTKRHLNNLDSGHHVFNTNDLDLCWTCIENLKPFRVPCNVYEHLRRIYII